MWGLSFTQRQLVLIPRSILVQWVCSRLLIGTIDYQGREAWEILDSFNASAVLLVRLEAFKDHLNDADFSKMNEDGVKISLIFFFLKSRIYWKEDTVDI